MITLSKPVQTTTTSLLRGGSVFCQPKLNGVRAYWDGNNLLTRNEKPILCVPHIVKELQKLAHIPFDGELYAHNMPFQDLNGLIRRKRHTREHLKISYFVFDLINEDQQYQRIKDINDLPKLDHVKIAPTIRTDKIEEAYNRALTKYEGLVCRRTTAHYGKGIYKIKPVFDQEYQITQFYNGGIICTTEAGHKFKTKCNTQGLSTGDSVTIEYSALTAQGFPFHGRFKAQRHDLPKEKKQQQEKQHKQHKQHRPAIKQQQQDDINPGILFIFKVIVYVCVFPLVLLFVLSRNK